MVGKASLYDSNRIPCHVCHGFGKHFTCSGCNGKGVTGDSPAVEAIAGSAYLSSLVPECPADIVAAARAAKKKRLDLRQQQQAIDDARQELEGRRKSIDEEQEWIELQQEQLVIEKNEIVKDRGDVNQAQALLNVRSDVLRNAEEHLKQERARYENDLTRLHDLDARESALNMRDEANNAKQLELNSIESSLKEQATTLQDKQAKLLNQQNICKQKAEELRDHAGEYRRNRALVRQLQEELAVRTSELDKRTRSLDRSNARAEVLANERSRLQLEVDVQRQALANAAKAEKRYRKATKELSNIGSPLHVSSPYVLSWIFEQYKPLATKLEDRHITCMGNGPWYSDEYEASLKACRFLVRQPPDSKVSRLVVGRKDWTEDSLLEQIRFRESEELRVYSQEMFVAMAATGVDPFDWDDDELLMEFANGHPALEFLMAGNFKWPFVSPNDDDGDLDGEDYSRFSRVTESPVHMLGYRVGAYGDPEPERHRILTEALSAHTLPRIESDELSRKLVDEYMASWGSGNSRRRLHRLATHIWWLIITQGQDDRKGLARDEWMADLKWLRKTYYKAHMRFRWPSTRV